jgi:hypothetical protein
MAHGLMGHSNKGQRSIISNAQANSACAGVQARMMVFLAAIRPYCFMGA